MPIMIYQDQIGKSFKFEKGDRIPQWLFANDGAYFDCNSLIITLKDHVHWFGKNSKDNDFIVVKSSHVRQVCPQISFYTTEDEVFVYKR